MRISQCVVAGVGALVLLVAPVTAQAQEQVSEQDQAFLVAAHQSNLAEIASGQAAVDQASTELVRAQGQMLITDHTALDADLQQVASQYGVELPGEPTPEQQAQLADVVAMEGAEFDQAWTTLQIAAHEAALALGETEIAGGTNPDVIALAEAAAPVIQRHLTMLETGEAPAPDGVHAGTGGPASHDGDRGMLAGLLAGLGVLALIASGVAWRRRA